MNNRLKYVFSKPNPIRSHRTFSNLKVVKSENEKTGAQGPRLMRISACEYWNCSALSIELKKRSGYPAAATQGRGGGIIRI